MAEFRRFNPEQWEPAGDADLVAKAAKPAKASEGSENALATLATLAGADSELPGTLAAGVASLDASEAPNRTNAVAWSVAVQDAARLVSEGWASHALALGWSHLDLFGAVPDPDGGSEGDGLAVKLNGRRMLAICESFATVADANGGRSYLYRGDTGAARLLWVLGRGR